MYFADLHIHSRYSRATSGDCDAPHLDLWARKKGIALLGTGDFTHPKWRAELRDMLTPAEEGLYTLKSGLRLPDFAPASEAPRFLVTGEISSIYKKNGRTRKVHNLILLPSLEAADALAFRLEQIGNIHSDGRPILGLDSRDLLEITLETCPGAVFIPAHIWTPHFSLFGAFSGFDTIEECFEDLTPHIHALETGLSSDPSMNWRVSALDRYTLVSNSDAHSPAKLAREANLLETDLSYPAVARALETGEGFSGTVEFFPEEGKYHLDGHRNCECRLTPEETAAHGGRCPVCGKPVTIGVQHRVLELADRPEGGKSAHAKPFESLVPLPELIGASIGTSADAKEARRIYAALLEALGPELSILRTAAPEDVERTAGPLVAEGLRRLRTGHVARLAGYDGAYGVIRLFAPGERETFLGQLALFTAPASLKSSGKAAANASDAEKNSQKEAEPAGTATLVDMLNPEQQSAVETADAAVAVIAGPGTGKTKTLVARIAHLIEHCGVKPAEITAVTFTNQAASEMRQRLSARLGKRAAGRMQIGTFHAICLRLLDSRPLLTGDEARRLVQEALRQTGGKQSAFDAQRAISRIKCGADVDAVFLDPGVYEAYRALCQSRGVRDLDDLLLDALALPEEATPQFRYLLVDEYQDVNAVQRRLIRKWSMGGKSLFVIGDPDQSIYGFRGADAGCFSALKRDFPDLRTIRLKTNYRSTPEIVASALAVISHNPGEARALEAARPKGEPVRLVSADTAFSEAVFIAKEIARMAGGVDMLAAQTVRAAQGETRPFSDMTVLARTHRQLELIESCLRHDGIPCVIAGRGNFLDDPAVRGVLAFFHRLLELGNAVALAEALELVYGVSACDAARLAAESAPALPAAFSADADEYAALLHGEPPQKLLTRWEATHGTSEALGRLADAAAFFPDMAEFLNALTLGEEADVRRASGKRYASGAVRLSTLHGAKGLEFPVVFLAGVRAGTLPLERADGCADMEEERRLLFVGMTRAREQLLLTTSESPSAFLAELPDTVEKSAAHTQRRAPEGKQLSLF